MYDFFYKNQTTKFDLTTFEIFRKKDILTMLLIKNIKQLIQIGHRNLLKGKELSILPSIENAFLLIEADKIKTFGSMDNCPVLDGVQTIDATGKMLLPSWVDSHTHLVFAASRENEFVDRIHGLTYQEIAQKGGGILNSAKRLRDTPEEVLFDQAYKRLQEVISLGTGAIEIKSGYGLSLEGELKMLRVIKKLKAVSPIPIKASFLAAHALPEAFKKNRTGYIDLIINEMLPIIAKENLADYVDVFCEKGFFYPAEVDQICKAAAPFGLKPKIHTNQFNSMGGIQVSILNNAISVDHLEVVSEQEIQYMRGSNTIATLLPSAPFFLNDHYPPAKRLIDADIAIALASDYNPGSSPSGNMSLVLSLACIKLKMTPQQAINAATLNGAYALEIADKYGSIEVGKVANLILTKTIPSIAFLPYSFGTNTIEKIIINGKVIDKN